MFYLFLGKEHKYRVKAFIDMLTFRAGEGLGAVLLLLFGWCGFSRPLLVLNLGLVAVCLGWLYAVSRTRLPLGVTPPPHLPEPCFAPPRVPGWAEALEEEGGISVEHLAFWKPGVDADDATTSGTTRCDGEARAVPAASHRLAAYRIREESPEPDFYNN